jgi:hypothetical protein
VGALDLGAPDITAFQAEAAANPSCGSTANPCPKADEAARKSLFAHLAMAGGTHLTRIHMQRSNI